VPAVARVEPLTTARALRGPFDYLHPEGESVGVGSLLVVPFGRRDVTGVVTALADSSEIAADRLVAPRKVLAHSLPPGHVELASWMAREYCSTFSRCVSLMLPPRSIRRDRGRRPVHEAVGARRDGIPELTGAQAAALSEILAAGPQDRLLLHGVTGSGKTEVYLRAVGAALERGDGAIVLVPEIGLTPQIVSRFVARFGDTVAVLHSALSAGERHDEWMRLRRGDARVCVGPRSAVFAPIERLGLIVIDEEHDASYKHEGDPRYDARLVAEQRGCLVVSGSATPRPESWRAMRRLTLAERVDGRPLPPVRVLDMRERRTALHPDTYEALVDAPKAIVLLNRRGWSNFLSCRTCGHAWSCPSCDVTLVLHRAGGYLACHHCGWRETVPERCSECASVAVARHGAGTERLEAELGETGLKTFRLDADVARAGDVLRAFESAERGVLVGTQMVAKGHDFPDVTLGVVLDADATLRFPDFRAEERTFSMVAQLAGRAGRGPGGGRVLVQTLAPDAPSIVSAARHDAAGFVAEELRRREALRYPPFSTLIRIVCSSEREGLAGEVAEAVKARLPGALGPAPLFRLRGRERSQVVVKAAGRAEAIAAVGAAVDAEHRRGVALSVDVDPQ